MTKVYVVMAHSMFYDNDSYITRIFSTLEAAEAFLAKQGDYPKAYDFAIDEWEVEDGQYD